MTKFRKKRKSEKESGIFFGNIQKLQITFYFSMHAHILLALDVSGKKIENVILNKKMKNKSGRDKEKEKRVKKQKEREKRNDCREHATVVV